MKNLKSLVCVLLLGFCISAPVLAANSDVGVVLMHGKWDTPPGWVTQLARELSSQGYLVSVPEMPWSRAREYDKDVDAAMAEIDAEVQSLRAKGATKIVVAGHSMGANSAMHYAGRTKVDGIVVLGLGNFTEGKRFLDALGGSVDKARDMVKAGRGAERASFNDENTGGDKHGNTTKTVSCPAKSYLSYFDPDGSQNASKNAAAVKPGTPVLWVVGTHDGPGYTKLSAAAHDRLPEHPASKLVQVDADHLRIPQKAIDEVLAWMNVVKGDQR